MEKIYMFVILAISVTGGIMAITSINAVTQANTINAIIPLSGHVSITGYDDNGNIKKYVETDNLIVNSAENCISKMLFAGASQETNVVCTGAITEPFTSMALSAASTVVTDTSEDLVGSDGLNSQIMESSFDCLGIGKVDSIVWTNASNNNLPASVILIKDFTYNAQSYDAVTLGSVGLFNGTHNPTNIMFAGQAIVNRDGSSLAMSGGETITIEWTFNIGD